MTLDRYQDIVMTIMMTVWAIGILAIGLVAAAAGVVAIYTHYISTSCPC